MIREIIVKLNESVKINDLIEGKLSKDEVEKIYEEIKNYLPKIFTEEKIKKMEELTDIPGNKWEEVKCNKSKAFLYKSGDAMPWIGVLMLNDKLFVLSFPSKKMGENAKKTIQSFTRLAKKNAKNEGANKISDGWNFSDFPGFCEDVDIRHGIRGVFDKGKKIPAFVNYYISWYDDNRKYQERLYSMKLEDIKKMYKDMVDSL